MTQKIANMLLPCSIFFGNQKKSSCRRARRLGKKGLSKERLVDGTHRALAIGILNADDDTNLR